MPAKRTGKKSAATIRSGGAKAKASAKKSPSPRLGGAQAAGAKGASGKQASKAVAVKTVAVKKAAKKGNGTIKPSVLVVNMIPRSLSGEINQDSEPTLAVNPANPDQIVGTAFTSNPAGGDTAPVFISKDGGRTWTLNAIVPSGVNPLFGSATGDITVSFGTTSNKLYAGILQDTSDPNDLPMDILGTDDFAGTSLMKKLLARDGPDQPYTHAATIPSGPNAGKDALYVGSNLADGTTTRTSTLDFSLNASSPSPTFKRVILESRSTGSAGQDGPQVRPTAHPDGTVYAAYTGWRASKGDFGANTLVITADVVVVRDDTWGSGAKPFTALIDPFDKLPGVRVVQGIKFPFHSSGRGVPGQNRLGGDVSIAVDPTDSKVVYLAYADGELVDNYTLHLRVSNDKGQTWSTDLLTVRRATNPALAVNSNGKLGFLYQQLTGASSAQRWETHLRRMPKGGGAFSDLTLNAARADFPVRRGDPYLGDYVHLQAVGKDFYGIFSANNTPAKSNFPNDVVYQRNANFTSRKLLDLSGTREIAISIDPFFFKVTE
ncbi:MAG: hypothetical protein QOJ76_1027 [Acidobacteriota bacterium]|jgi:hypothetical protein|nr:hypothetical protein [Acidobacteriota bacterium]